MGLVLTPPLSPQNCSAEVLTNPPVAVVSQTIEENEYKTPKRHGGVVLTKKKSPLGNNCVAYARSQADIPQNLWSLADKKKHIKTKTPYKGAVGVTAESSSGHLVVIQEIIQDTLIVSEGNWLHGYITTRAVPASLLLGYY